jgi:hypothetical protein
MCRNIKTLYNYDPPASEDEIRAAALQYVRKISGFHRPSKINEAAFQLAMEAVTAASRDLLEALQTDAPRRDRAKEQERAKARALRRFAS